MFAEVLCGAVALLLYVNTLDADFCYDDRYLRACVVAVGVTHFGGFVSLAASASPVESRTPRRSQVPAGRTRSFEASENCCHTLNSCRRACARVTLEIKIINQEGCFSGIRTDAAAQLQPPECRFAPKSS